MRASDLVPSENQASSNLAPLDPVVGVVSGSQRINPALILVGSSTSACDSDKVVFTGISVGVIRQAESEENGTVLILPTLIPSSL